MLAVAGKKQSTQEHFVLNYSATINGDKLFHIQNTPDRYIDRRGTHSPKFMPSATLTEAGLAEMSSHHALTWGRSFINEDQGVFMK